MLEPFEVGKVEPGSGDDGENGGKFGFSLLNQYDKPLEETTESEKFEMDASDSERSEMESDGNSGYDEPNSSPDTSVGEFDSKRMLEEAEKLNFISEQLITNPYDMNTLLEFMESVELLALEAHAGFEAFCANEKKGIEEDVARMISEYYTAHPPPPED